MHIVYLLLLLGATISFGIGAFARPATPRINFLGLGLLLWVLVDLLKAFV